MNQTFDVSRWWKLVTKHWAENAKKYLLGSLAVAGILAAWYTVAIFTDNARPIYPEIQVATYFTGLFLAGCLYASMIFSEINTRPKGIDYLTLPASHFEKLLVALFNAVVAFFVVYTIVFYIVDFAMVEISRSMFRSKYPGVVDQSKGVVNVFTIFSDPLSSINPSKIILLIFFAVQSAFILGSVYFGTYSFIKTTVTLFIVSLAVVLFVAKVLVPTLPERTMYWSITSLRIVEMQGPGRIVSLPSWIGEVLQYLVMYAFAPLFYIVTYFRLKEKEI